MPYRRLPETDQARYTALKKAVEQISEHRSVTNPIVEYSTFDKAQKLCNQFAIALDQFRNLFSGRVDNNKQYRTAYKNVRMYITHFIKVVNMSIQRGELPKNILSLYNLPSSNKIPPLQKDKDILQIGKNLIEGERKRIQNGGFPIYYPNINKVKLHYDVFKDYAVKSEFHKQNLQRVNTTMENLRKEIDEFIPILWNQIENRYDSLNLNDKIATCQKFGIVYYYRKDENVIKNKLSNIFKDVLVNYDD